MCLAFDVLGGALNDYYNITIYAQFVLVSGSKLSILNEFPFQLCQSNGEIFANEVSLC